MDNSNTIHAIKFFTPSDARHPAFSMGRWKSTIKLGVKSLWNHQLRSLLTVLGIVFGVCSVIAMLAIGEGASFEAQEQIRQLGSQNIIIRSVKPSEEKKSSARDTFRIDYGLTYADLGRLRETLPSVQVTVPARIIRKEVWNGGRRADCDIYGTVPWYSSISNHRVSRGRFFTQAEMEDGANVCLLDEGAAKTLFPMDAPLGRTVHIGTQYYRVIGVIEPKTRIVAKPSATASSPGGGQVRAVSYQMFIPLKTAKNRFGETLVERRSGSFSAEKVELHEVIVRVAALEDVLETSQIIQAILDYHHKKKDYEIVVPLELLRQAERTKQIFNVVLGGIAAISLLVGGIGIMNIMLASVTERTREIGIRRALGAKRKDIVTQFLAETVILSGVGGLIGVALGLTIPFLISRFAHMVTIVTFWSPPLAFSISAMVGVIFGLYPAFRAANMDPVEALRHE